MEDQILLQILNELKDLKQGQQTTNQRLNKIEEDIVVMKEDIVVMKEDIIIIKEDTAITRETTNTLVKWSEVAGDVLNVRLDDVI